MRIVHTRGQANLIGFIFIFAGVIALSGFILSTVTLPFVDTAVQSNAEFDIEVSGDENNVTVTYAAGDPFTTENAREIRLVREGTSERRSTAPFPLRAGEPLVDDVPMSDSEVFVQGAEVRVILIDSEGGSRTLDRLFLPTADQIGELED